MADTNEIMEKLEAIENATRFLDFSEEQFFYISIGHVILFALTFLIMVVIRIFNLRNKDSIHSKRDYKYLKWPVFSVFSYSMMVAIFVTGIFLMIVLLGFFRDYANSTLFSSLLTTATVFISVGISMMIYTETEHNKIIKEAKDEEIKSQNIPFNSKNLEDVLKDIRRFKNKTQKLKAHQKKLSDIETKLDEIILYYKKR
ncbi:hypothetical protein [Planomicrobium okeanokoites]|uniref:hypothetical protein n=1 Tax=Planomicrobium okeanokoites TaxID=244 RepID=UPI00249144D4|nr:hypothetical protein [Planomicrobium okeanokoites]